MTVVFDGKMEETDSFYVPFCSMGGINLDERLTGRYIECINCPYSSECLISIRYPIIKSDGSNI